MARKADLGASHGQLALLILEQARFPATNSVWLAELNARDLAAICAPGANDGSATEWLYCAFVTLTDSRYCADPATTDARLIALRGPAFAMVAKIIRDLPPDRLAAAQAIGTQLAALQAAERTDNAVCRAD